MSHEEFLKSVLTGVLLVSLGAAFWLLTTAAVSAIVNWFGS